MQIYRTIQVLVQKWVFFQKKEEFTLFSVKFGKLFA